MAGELNKFLTFTIGQETYGIPVLSVKEIIGMMEITHVPRMPEFIKGIVNLRGKIIPIMDLRSKFGLSPREYDDRTCIIVVEMEMESNTRLTGFVVDTVSEVLDIDRENIEDPPQCYEDTEGQYLTGIGKIKDKVIMLLETEKMLTSSEKQMLQKS